MCSNTMKKQNNHNSVVLHINKLGRLSTQLCPGSGAYSVGVIMYYVCMYVCMYYVLCISLEKPVLKNIFRK